MKTGRTILYLTSLAVVGLVACNHQEEETKAKQQAIKDSLLVRQVQHKDSSIMDYISSFNNIQHSIDTLMIDAKVLKVHSAEHIENTGTLLTDIRTIGAIILKDQRALATMQMKLKKSNEQNDELADLGEALSKQLNEKDSEINAMQSELVKTKASLGTLVKQFNDSMTTIMQQRSQINILQIAGNTVYYVYGTENDLVSKGLIVKEGGAVGLGRVPVLSQAMNNDGLTKGDLTQLHEIALGGRLVKLITVHPQQAYRITTDGSHDKIIITDPQDFWSKSKYLVAIID